MKKSTKLLTTAEFAKLHDVNKRTLHYYDSIGLFSPAKKGKINIVNYETSQSMEFELYSDAKELNMSIGRNQEIYRVSKFKGFSAISRCKNQRN